MQTAALSVEKSLVLDYKTSRALIFQAGLVAAAVALPALCHLAGAPVRVILPMHWPVLAAGLVYGWRGGLMAGLAAPAASFALSGMPAAALLPVMGPEIAVYGFAAGFLRQNMRLSSRLALLGAVIAGRAAFLAAGAAFTQNAGMPGLAAALLPGIPAALAQIAALPAFARKMTGNE
ncbi:MAG: hypothetical protein WC421_06830 [Elusimicrobiales bacterium]